MRLRRRNLFFYAPLQQATGIPPGHQLQIVALQDWPQQTRLAWEFITEFKARKTSLFTFAQTGIQRRFRAKRGQIIIGPCQRINA